MALKFWGLKQASHTLHIDVNRHCVILEQKEVYLSTNEFEVLYLLQQSPQTTFTKEQIYKQIWHEPTNNQKAKTILQGARVYKNCNWLWL